MWDMFSDLYSKAVDALGPLGNPVDDMYERASMRADIDRYHHDMERDYQMRLLEEESSWHDYMTTRRICDDLMDLGMERRLGYLDDGEKFFTDDWLMEDDDD